MHDPKETRESTAAEIGEIAAEVTAEGVIEGAFEIVGTAADHITDGVGSVLDGISIDI